MEAPNLRLSLRCLRKFLLVPESAEPELPALTYLCLWLPDTQQFILIRWSLDCVPGFIQHFAAIQEVVWTRQSKPKQADPFLPFL